MSDDSDDDLSTVGDSESDADMEVEEVAEEPSTEMELDADGDDASDERSPFQKELWPLKHLPYYSELEREADDYFRHIKAGLAHSIVLKDIKMGFIHWLCELENKRGLLTANDLQLDWRPLYELYYELSYKNLEEDGVFLLPEGFRSDVGSLVGYCRNYWKPNATQEMLDELRPYFCLWDESMIRAFKLLELFLPTSLKAHEHKEFGASLWFDEFWHFYVALENNSSIEEKLLSWDCPGLIDWSPYLDVIFTKISRSLRLGEYIGLSQNMHMDTTALWVSYMLGGPHHAQVQAYMDRLMKMIESFCHPSNDGSHTLHLLNFLWRMAHHVVVRLKRERHVKRAAYNPVPPEMFLTDAQIERYVMAMKPCLSLVIFSKKKTEFIPFIVRDLTLLAPHIVIPVILELVYPAIQTVTEPHRLTQALNCLLSSSLSLIRDKPTTPDGLSHRSHCLVLIQELLPGIDVNDMRKSVLTFQVLAMFVTLIPMSDCSMAVHVRNDLTVDEAELCGLTARMEDIVCMVMDKLLAIIDTFVSPSSAGAQPAHGALTKLNAKTSDEERISMKGTNAIFRGMVNNTSTALYDLVITKLYYYMEDGMCDNKAAADSVSDMVSISVRSHPARAFEKLLDLTMKNLRKYVTPDAYNEERSDFAVIWWLTMATKVVRVPGEYLIKRKETLTEMLRLIMPLKSRTASHLSCTVLEEIGHLLTTVYPQPNYQWRADLDKPVEDFLPIRHWARITDRRTFRCHWFVPTADSISFCNELLGEWFYPLLEALRRPVDMDKHQILHNLYLIESVVVGCSFSMPYLPGERIKLNDSVVFVNPLIYVAKPAGTPDLLAPDGGNVREVVRSSITDLLNFLLGEREDDVKSISMVLRILSVIVFTRGTTKTKHHSDYQMFLANKRLMTDPLRGPKANPDWVTREYIALHHQRHVVARSGHLFTKTHIDVIHTLLKVSTSHYSENRAQAQSLLLSMFKVFPYSYMQVLDKILDLLKPDKNISHEQFKGGLYLLVEGKRTALVLKHNWEAILKIWPTLVRAQHSEKPSIIALIEMAQNSIVDNFESFRLKEHVPEAALPYAMELLLGKAKDAGTQRHVPAKGCPSQAEIEAAHQRFDRMNARNLQNYNQLCSELLALASDQTLHWRHTDLSHALLSLMIRRDLEYPTPGLKLFVRLLVNDSVKTRKVAGAVVSAWLKMNKPKSFRCEYLLDQEPNTGPGAKWPIRYGLRKDNREMCYDEENLPKTVEEYNNFRFCGKQHWGFYTWPVKLMTYGTLAQQVDVNRPESSFSEVEQYVVGLFRDPKFLDRLLELMSIEEKKVNDTEDYFNTINFSLFQGLFRNYNDSLVDVFRPHLERLCKNEKEQSQKLAGEIAAGLVIGSKLWRYEKQQKLWEWLGPLLLNTMLDLKDTTVKCWGVSVATMCGCIEMRMAQPLIEILFELIKRPIDNNFQLSSRLFIIQGGLCQWEWRALALWHRLRPFLTKYIALGYQNVRERLGVCLTTLAWFDVPTIYVDPSLPDSLKLPRFEDCTKMIDPYLTTAWDEVYLKGVINPEVGGSTSSTDLMFQPGAVDSEAKKQSRLALKTLICFILNSTIQSYVSWPPSFIKYIPMLAHFSNDVGDEELVTICRSLYRDLLSTVRVSNENAGPVLDCIEKYFEGPGWWKARLFVLRNMRLLIFSNVFVFLEHRERIGRIISRQLRSSQLEVREAATQVLSGLVHCGFFEATAELMGQLEHMAMDRNGPISDRHAGVLGLAGVVLAFPYSVPHFLPDVVMKLCRHSTDDNPMRDTVKKTMAEFKRTHQDSWHEHKKVFTEDQLSALTDLLVSPNYYV
ncbi:unnamed protein product, partial [Mesorhabditis spiculigera]